MSKKIIGIIALSFIIGNGSANSLSLPPLFIPHSSFLKRSDKELNWKQLLATEEMKTVSIFKFNKAPRPDIHNKGILKLKPKWFPRSARSKRGERTYYYWVF